MEITLDTNMLMWFAGIMTPISVVGIRHWIIKSRCFTILQTKVEALESHDEGSTDTHRDIFSRLDRIDRNVYLIMGKMKITPVD